MTISGSGQGGVIGRLPEPTDRELENTAATQIARQMMGIVADSLDIPFTQIGGNIWRYQSDAGRPLLPHLGTTRIAKEQSQASGGLWKDFFKELVDKLPLDLRERLNEDMAKSFEDHHPSLLNLRYLLSNTAKGLAWLKQAAEPMADEGAEVERTLDNRQLYGKALKGMFAQNKGILREGEVFLKEMQNAPDYDALMNYLKEGEECQSRFMDLADSLQDPGSEPPTSDEISALTSKIERLLQQFTRIPPGKELQMLGPMFEAMAIMSEAMAVTPASPSLFLGLKVATKGMKLSESKTGMIAEELELLLDAIINGTIDLMIPEANKSKKLMMAMLIVSTMIGADTLAALMGEYGIGPTQGRDEEGGDKASKNFGLKLALQLIASSSILNEIFKSIAKISEMPEKQVLEIADSLSLAALLTMALGVIQGEMEHVIVFLQGLKEGIGEKLDGLEEVISQSLAESRVSGSIPTGIEIAVQQARIALKDENWNGFLVACSNGLELIKSSPEQLKEDIEELKNFGIQVMRAASGDVDRDTNQATGFITAA